MTKIDEATGLAALPEGLFWKVQQASVGYGSNATMVDTVSISLCETYTEVEPAFTREVRVNSGGLRGFFGGTKFVKEAVPESTRTFTRYLHSGSLLETSTEKPKDTSGWFVRTYDEYFGYHYDTVKEYYRVTPCTPDNLRELSVKMWVDYLNQQHEQALKINSKVSLKAFLGDYPPKNLNTVSA